MRVFARSVPLIALYLPIFLTSQSSIYLYKLSISIISPVTGEMANQNKTFWAQEGIIVGIPQAQEVVLAISQYRRDGGRDTVALLRAAGKCLHLPIA